jgi:hypothetical protein
MPFRSVFVLVLLLFNVGLSEAGEVVVPVPSLTPLAVGWRLVDSRKDLRRRKVGPETRLVLPPARRRFDLTAVDGGMIRVGFAIADRAWRRGLEEAEF